MFIIPLKVTGNPSHHVNSYHYTDTESMIEFNNDGARPPQTFHTVQCVKMLVQ